MDGVEIGFLKSMKLVGFTFDSKLNWSCMLQNTSSGGRSVSGASLELYRTFSLTHDDERAPAAAASGEGRKSVQALRSIDLQTRSTDLDVFVCIAADKTPLLALCQNPAVESHHSPPARRKLRQQISQTPPGRNSRPMGEKHCGAWRGSTTLESHNDIDAATARQCHRRQRGLP